MPAEQGWALETDGTSEPRQLFPTLEAAISAGWTRARRESVELHIQPLAGEVCMSSAANQARSVAEAHGPAPE
ncbi:conserved hypothetical protein [Cupriavidus taiwanensis]|uniref:DUF2188 domain-containing protein n=1 Tax=Cupriavidus taiwanensis TaxID=164546 RepID=UPI000E16EB23|nr:DUF2188 domain-containing protein [Cupriavidus taiwanensis]SOZ52560.1 conserved hypothetical protein [Cupriavidus taiwanensis]SOZ54019.1 conserved hypothetical protein [Cupriavidus taiwanensis]SOZ97894.1 conserved hypothetical protein [Cupriavidus taiwanensis]SPA04776.1 conserved hypothetical protein [Cupriavidus taiwanensis]SPA16311.1 conserved hypothetical protein [Cupriavidus taiwanensis]